MRDEQDKKLADKGWHSMQQWLDREMPTERKRRPFAWWWLGLLLLPLATWGGYAWWHSTQPEHPAAPRPVKQERPVVQRNTENPASTVGATGSMAAQPEAGTVADPNHGATTTDRAVGSSSGTATRLRTSTDRPVYRTPERTPRNIDNQQDISTTSVLPEAEKAAGLPDMPDFKPPFPVETTIETTYALALPFDAVQKEQHFTLNAPLPTPIKPVGNTPAKASKSIPRWSLGLTAGVSTERFTDLNGFSGGLTADWHFARKWGVRGSLLYTRYLPSASKQPVVAVEEVRYSNATGLFTGNNSYQEPDGTPISPVTSEEVDLEYVYIPLRKLHQIEMPVLAYWQPHRNLRLYSGLALDYTFFGQSAGQNYINNQVVSLDSYGTRKSASRVATDELPPLQLHYQGGLGFQFGRHVEISAFVRIPIRNVFPQARNLATYNSDNAQFNDPNNQPLDVMNSTTTAPLPRLGRFVLQGTWLF